MNALPSAIPLQFVREFPRDVSESLWSQGVNLDDWDYAIIASIDILSTETRQESWQESLEDVHEPKDWSLSRLLTGCCSNAWYKAKINGEEVALGIAYHS